MRSTPPPAVELPPGAVDVSVSLERANVVGAVIFVAALLLVLLPFALVWGWPATRAGFGTALATWWFLPGAVLLIVAHEALHGVGFRLLGRAPREALHYGVDRSTLTPFAGCRVPLSAAAYRGAVILPALVLGVAPAAWGMATGTGWVAVVGALMLGAAGGDLLILWVIRHVPGTARVLDHPTRAGCWLVPDAPGVPVG